MGAEKSDCEWLKTILLRTKSMHMYVILLQLKLICFYVVHVTDDICTDLKSVYITLWSSRGTLSDTDVIHQTTLTRFVCFVLDIDYRALELCNHGTTLPKIKHFTYIIKKYVVFTLSTCKLLFIRVWRHFELLAVKQQFTKSVLQITHLTCLITW